LITPLKLPVASPLPSVSAPELTVTVPPPEAPSFKALIPVELSATKVAPLLTITLPLPAPDGKNPPLNKRKVPVCTVVSPVYVESLLSQNQPPVPFIVTDVFPPAGSPSAGKKELCVSVPIKFNVRLPVPVKAIAPVFVKPTPFPLVPEPSIVPPLAVSVNSRSV